MHRSLSLAAWTLMLAPAATAQGELYTWPTIGAVAHAGDVDGDGLADFARTATSPTGIGELHVHSGATGAVLFSDYGAAPSDGYGRAVCGVGDVDGDGLADVVVASSLYLRCMSGATGFALWHSIVRPGCSLTSIADIDGDGAGELVVGTPSGSFGTVGKVLVRSGRTGSLLHAVVPPAGASAAFGSSVASAGDFDSDGAEDLLVGDLGGAGGLGVVSVHSIAGSLQLASFTGPVNPYTTSTGFGWSVATPGDIDGDAVSDVLVGSPSECLWGGGTHGCVSGRARLLSGATGAELQVFQQSTAFAGFGVVVAAFPDLDGDGLDDVLVSNPTFRAGCCIYLPAEVFVFSSASGATLYTGNHHGGLSVAVVPDLNGDGVAEYVTSPFFTVSTLLALPFTGPSGTFLLCTPKLSSDGCLSSLQMEGTPSLSVGADLVVRAPNVRPSTAGMFLHGAQETTIPFAGGTLCIAPPIRRLAAGATGGSTVLCSGVLEQRFTKASLAALGYAPGATFTIQAWYRDQGFAAPDNVGMSDALIISIWP